MVKVKGYSREVFTVGSFARLGGVSAKVLRTYDRLGLFRPVWVDPDSGYRYYSPAQLPELRRILALRDMGIGLADIGRIASDGDLRAALERRRTELRRERREIDRRLAALEIRVAGSGLDTSPPDVVLRPIATEPVACLEVAPGEPIDAAFTELEAHVRDHGRRAHRPPGALVERVSQGGDRSGVVIYVPVGGPFEPTARISYRRLPACRAATLIERGPYDRVSRARNVLDRWIAAAGLEPVGPLRIVYLQFGAEPELRLPHGYVVERAAEYVTELQQPVL